MAWFGLVEDKFCNLCNAKLGVLLDNNSLKDGNRICNECEAKLSPLFTRRKQSTLEEIKQQLEYREQNKALVAQFNPIGVYGYSLKVYVDPMAGKFCVARGNDWRSSNPDIIDLSQVLSATVDIRERRNEIKTRDAEGREVSCSPPQYEYSYDFHLDIHVNSPWFSDIHVDLTDDNYLPKNRAEDLYRQYETMSRECAAVLLRQATPGQFTNSMNMNGFNAFSLAGVVGAVAGAVMGGGANIQQGLMRPGQPMQGGMPMQGQMMGQPMQGGMMQGGMPMQGQMMGQPMQGGMMQGQMPMQGQMMGQPMQGGMMQGGMPMQGQMMGQPMQGGMMQGGGFCPNCGTPAQPGSAFCTSCGTPMK